MVENARISPTGEGERMQTAEIQSKIDDDLGDDDDDDHEASTAPLIKRERKK